MIGWILIPVLITLLILVVNEVTDSTTKIYYCEGKEYRIHRSSWTDMDSNYEAPWMDVLEVKLSWGPFSYWKNLAVFSNNDVLNPIYDVEDDYSKPIERNKNSLAHRYWTDYEKIENHLDDHAMELLKLFAGMHDMKIGKPAETGIMQTRFEPGVESCPGYTTGM